MRGRTLTLCLLLLGPTLAHAAPGACYLSVGGRTYLDGPCNVDLQPGGSFSIGTGDRSRSRYVAYVTIENDTGTARGSWNGVASSNHAESELGTLTRRGGCWRNEGAKVCAWKRGARPATF